MPLLKSENVLHAVQARRPPHQPFGRPQGASREGDAIRGPVGDFDPLPRGGEGHRVLAHDVPGAQAGKADAAGGPRRGLARPVIGRDILQAPRRAPPPPPRPGSSAVPGGGIALHAMVRLEDFHIVGRSQPRAAMAHQFGHHAHPDAGIGRNQHRQSSRAARSTTPRPAASSPVAPIRIGTPAAAQARACSATPLLKLKSTATDAPRNAQPRIRGDQHPGGRRPRRRHPVPAAALSAEATAPLRVRAGRLPQRPQQRLSHAPGDAEDCDGLHARSPSRPRR